MTPIVVEAPCGEGMLSRLEDVTADVHFVSTRMVFAGWRCGSAQDSELRVLRYREVQGIFGEAAEIGSFTIGGEERARLAITSERILYVSAPQREAADLFRLNYDGTTPKDNPSKLARVSTFERVYAMSGLVRALYVSTSGGLVRLASEEPRGLQAERLDTDGVSTRSIASRSPDWILAEIQGELLEFRALSSGALARAGSLRVSQLGSVSSLAEAGDGSLFVVAETETNISRLYRLRPTP